jgi:hypothetical protein
MTDSQKTKKSWSPRGWFPKSTLRRQVNPQPSPSDTNRISNSVSRTPQPSTSQETASLFGSALQTADSSDKESSEHPIQTGVEPVVELTSSIQVTQPAASSSLQSSDRNQTTIRYSEAYNALRKAIERDNSLSAVFDELSTNPEGDDSMFINKLHSVLESQNSKVNDRSAWGTCKSTVKYLVHTFKPFAKNFLVIAREGSAVYTFFRSYLTSIDSNLEPVWIAMWWLATTHQGSTIPSWC